MPFKKLIPKIAEAIQRSTAQQGQPSAPRGGRGFGSAIMNALQQMPQAAGAPRRRGLMGAVQQVAQAGTLRPTAMKKGGAVKKVAAKKVAAKKPVMKAKARKK